MWYHWLLFIFLAFISKALLAFVIIYLLLPGDRSCGHCNEETLLIRVNRAARLGFALALGRLQWRWCPRCGWEGLARRVRVEGASAAKQVRTRVTYPSLIRRRP